MAGRRHALLIGINHYPNLNNADLDGCANDVELMHSVLVDHAGFAAEDTRALRDAEATQASIRSAMEELADRVGQNDVAVLFYAGHGSRIRDPQTPGRMIESMVPHDSGRGDKPNRDILDEEIDRWIQRLNEKTPYVTLIFDCCHSGSVTRDPFGTKKREVEPDLRAPEEMFRGAPLPDSFTARRSLGDGPRKKTESGWLPGRRQAVLIAACRADEEAGEHNAFEGKDVLTHGALTYFLGSSLTLADRGATWRDIFERVAPVLTAKHGHQHPQLEGKVDELIFGTEEVRPASYLGVVSVDGSGVELAGGAAHGVRPGSLWTLRSHGAGHRRAKQEIARLEVTTVHAARCRANVVPGSTTADLEPGQRAFLLEQEVEAPGLTVAISAPEDQREAVSRRLRHSELLSVAGNGRGDIRLYCLAPRETVAPGAPCPALGALSVETWAAVGGDGHLAVRSRPTGPRSAEALNALVEDLEGKARYSRLLALGNPDAESALRGRVHLRLRRRQAEEKRFVEAEPEAGTGVVIYREGEKADMKLVNNSDRRVWVSVVEFGADGRIRLLMPRQGHPTARKGSDQGGIVMEPGEARGVHDYYVHDPRFADLMKEGLPLRLPPGFPWAAEPGERTDYGLLYLKVLVTPAPADFEFLEQGATRPVPNSHPLYDLAMLYSTGKGKRSFFHEPAETAPEADWATFTVPVGVRR